MCYGEINNDLEYNENLMGCKIIRSRWCLVHKRFDCDKVVED